MRRFIAVVVIGLACNGALASQRRGQAPVPSGSKVASGRHFDVYVVKTEEKPAAAGYVLRIFQMEAVARTAKHGIQRFKRRLEAMDADLLDARNWEIVDFDRDGWDDFRYVSGVTKKGCRTWEAERWEPEHDRFMLAAKFARWSDAQNKPVVPNCIGK